MKAAVSVAARRCTCYYYYLLDYDLIPAQNQVFSQQRYESIMNQRHPYFVKHC